MASIRHEHATIKSLNARQPQSPQKLAIYGVGGGDRDETLTVWNDVGYELEVGKHQTSAEWQQ